MTWWWCGRSWPKAIRSWWRSFSACSRRAKTAGPAPADGRDGLPIGKVALRPAVELALRYADEQGLLPRRLGAEELWEGLPA